MRVAVLIAAVVGVAGPVRAQDAAIDWSAVDAVFADYDRSNVPGCAVGVVRSGVLEYGRGYGMANLDHGIAITPLTVFRTGSVAKQFTAAAIAIASEEGVIDLDDPVRRWITELPEYPVEPTIRQVVHHTSGLRDYLVLMALKGLRNDDFYTDAEVRAAITRQRELNFTPGSEHLYSNAGYFLLGEIIREATGMTLREYAQEKIFGPLGMTHSHFHDDHNHIVPLRATGYAPTDEGFRISVTTLDMVGDGGVFTSTEDLVKWVTALNDDTLAGGINDVLESRRPLQGAGDRHPYAFGQVVGRYRGVKTISHGGAFVGYRADITRFPDQDVSIVTSCNRADANPSLLARRVADVVLASELGRPERDDDRGSGNDGRDEDELDPVEGPVDYLGSYYSPELDVTYRLTLEGEDLRVSAGAIRGVLLQERRDRLVLGGIVFRFERDGGRVVGFELDAGRVQNLAFTRTSEGG